MENHYVTFMTHLTKDPDSSNVLLGLFLGRNPTKIFENERDLERNRHGELVFGIVALGIETGYGRNR